MITATLTHLERVRDQWRITILYTDTDTRETFEKNYRYASITKRQLRNVARAEAAAIGGNETTDIDIPIGTVIDVTPDAVTLPTQDEIDAAAWFADWDRLNKMQSVLTKVPALDTPQRQTLITNLQTSLATDWKNSYLDNI